MEAVAVGLDPDVIDVVRNRESLTGLGDQDAVIIQAGREIYGEHHLSAETYRRAVDLFGEANFVDVVDLMARYAGTAGRLAAFNQHMPPGWPQFLPLPFTQPDDVDPQSRSRLPLLPAPEPRRCVPPPASTAGRCLRRGRDRDRSAATAPGRESLEANVARPLLDLGDPGHRPRVRRPVHVDPHRARWRSRTAWIPTVIDVVRSGGSVAGLGDKEAAFIEFGRQLFGPHTVTSETYASALEAVGGLDQPGRSGGPDGAARLRRRPPDRVRPAPADGGGRRCCRYRSPRRRVHEETNRCGGRSHEYVRQVRADSAHSCRDRRDLLCPTRVVVFREGRCREERKSRSRREC